MKANVETLPHRRPLRFWAPGYADEESSSNEKGLIRTLELAANHGGHYDQETANQSMCNVDEAAMSCRFTHVYPDEPAPCFTFTALGSHQGNLAGALQDID